MLHAERPVLMRHGIVFAALLGFGIALGFGTPRAAARTPITPVAGGWCGITDSGGSVRFNVSSDGRFVSGIAINTTRGSLFGGEGYRENPSQQIKDSKFIYRRDRTEFICDRRSNPRQPVRPAPCRRPPCAPAGCTERSVNELMVRATFTAPESARGSFTWAPDRQRIVGSYTAWPVDIAPCP